MFEHRHRVVSVIDVVQVLTDSSNARDYGFKMKLRAHQEDGTQLPSVAQFIETLFGALPAFFKLEFGDRQQAFVDFVPGQYVAQGVGELDSEKLSPLLKLRYRNAMADAVKDLGSAEEIRRVFVGFQRHLY